jgi:hypothetical protein
MTRKSTYEFSDDIKLKLATLRADLRYDGLPATEKSILELLVRSTSVTELRRLFARPRPKIRRPKS